MWGRNSERSGLGRSCWGRRESLLRYWVGCICKHGEAGCPRCPLSWLAVDVATYTWLQHMVPGWLAPPMRSKLRESGGRYKTFLTPWKLNGIICAVFFWLQVSHQVGPGLKGGVRNPTCQWRIVSKELEGRSSNCHDCGFAFRMYWDFCLVV